MRMAREDDLTWAISSYVEKPNRTPESPILRFFYTVRFSLVRTISGKEKILVGIFKFLWALDNAYVVKWRQNG